jgi:uncharacterized circularly permuted ATP-grasp superfamily protein
MSTDAVREYHDLVGRGNLAAESQGALEAIQTRRGLNFGTRPACTVIRPRFVTQDQYRFLRTRTETLGAAFDAAYRRAMDDATFRKQFGLRDWEEALLAIDPGFDPPNPTSRFDSFVLPDGTMRFTEYNTETPAGAGYSDALGELFYGIPAFQEFNKSYYTFPIVNKPGILHAIMDSFYQWQGHTSERPRIAILDWREVPTYSEFVLFYDYFQSMDIEARIIDPRDVEFTNDKLMAGDYHINLIYKRVLIHELIDRCGVDNPVVQAVRAGAVCMANTFRCKIIAKKASLAVLSDERNAALFTDAQKIVIEAHIPWTRVVEERKTTFDGKSIDLIPYMLANKDHLVLKPNDDYGGKGIVLGWTVDAASWANSVRHALADPYVVQDKIPLPYEDYPSVHDGKLHIIPRMMDTNPYMAFGKTMHGCLTRISTDELVNVTAGGGSTIPTFLIEKR